MARWSSRNMIPRRGRRPTSISRSATAASVVRTSMSFAADGGRPVIRALLGVSPPQVSILGLLTSGCSHEIVGTAVRVGSKAESRIKVGDRVGVGAQSSSCLRPDCEECAAGIENHCPRIVGTYNATYPDGSKAMGGYGDYARVPSHFVIKIPDALSSEEAAPMLCGGITAFSPLAHNGCGPGKKVGIVGFGGLGHFGVLYAKALGADKVTVISRTTAKKADAEKVRRQTSHASVFQTDSFL